MSRIAVKIFLAFWLTFFLLVTGFSVLLDLLREQETVQPLGAFQQRQVQQHEEQILAIYQRRGVAGLRRFAQDIQDNRGISLFFLDDEGKDLLEQDLAPSVLTYFKQQRQAKAPQMQMREGRLLLGPVAFPNRALPVSILLWLPMAANEARSVNSLLRGRYALLQIGLGLLMSGIVSLLLALSLTRPLNRLERAAHRLAQGRFETSEIDAVASRKDEIGSLAKAFSVMAARLASVLESQQRLLRDVSHELRSPLTRLQVAIGLASRQPAADSAASFERMEAECERLNALIGEVLALARAENDEQHNTIQEFDLVQTLQALSNDAKFEAQAQQKDVQLEAPAQLLFLGNENAISSAVENIVRNAIHYGAVNSTVRLSLKATKEAVLIKISDTGPGLPEAELTKIFIPFYRVSEARERRSGGSGVGLAIAARVVHSHGGQIVARNRASGGLEVEMRLPKVPGRSRIKLR